MSLKLVKPASQVEKSWNDGGSNPREPFEGRVVAVKAIPKPDLRADQKSRRQEEILELLKTDLAEIDRHYLAGLVAWLRNNS